MIHGADQISNAKIVDLDIIECDGGAIGERDDDIVTGLDKVALRDLPALKMRRKIDDIHRGTRSAFPFEIGDSIMTP